jgi:hypothetical protein
MPLTRMFHEAVVPEAGQAGDFVVVVDHEAVARVEVGIAAVQGEIVRVDAPAQTRRGAAAFVSGSVVDGVRPAVGRLEHQSMSKPLLELDLKRVVVRHTHTSLSTDRSEDVPRSVCRMVWIQQMLDDSISHAIGVRGAFGCALR